MAGDAPRARTGAVAKRVALHWINECTAGAGVHLLSFDPGHGFTGAQRMRTIVLAILVLSLSTSCLFAHGPEAPRSVATWTFDPWIIVPLLVIGVSYAVGSIVLWRRALVRRHRRAWRTLAFFLGWLTVVVALVSPLHWLGEHLFSFHMIEHEILMAVSAPLLVIARPIGPLLWSLPRDVRTKAGRLLKRPAVSSTWAWLTAGRNATLVHGIAIWAWHDPVLFDAAVSSVTIHRLQHLSFLLTAVLFWWSALRRSNAGLAAWHVFITMLHMSFLGALMALAPRALYVSQSATVAAWGLTPLEDQQLAGLIMWVPAGTVYAGAALALIAVWIRSSSECGKRGDALHVL